MYNRISNKISKSAIPMQSVDGVHILMLHLQHAIIFKANAAKMYRHVPSSNNK